MSTPEIIQTITSKILAHKQTHLETAPNTPVIIAIDGRCASGKTTIAKALQTTLSCNVFHMDDFFLQEHMRTKTRLEEPGGNVDRERFLDEVLKNLKQNIPFTYRLFDCKTMTLSSEISVTPSEINIVEGSYSLHPMLSDYYDLRIFIDVEKDEQLNRIKNRNPEKLQMFIDRWIPLEEKYFNAFNIRAKCDIVFMCP